MNINYDLAMQRSIIIQNLPMQMYRVQAMLKRGDRQLTQMIDSRLTSGHGVFGSRMFNMPQIELMHEGVEELADSLLYFCAAADTGLGGRHD